MAQYDIIIIGAGHNGLVAAAYLARAGKKVLVLERRDNVGGIAATEEILPGFRFATCAHLCDGFSERIIGDLELKKHGLEILPLNPLLLAPLPNGNSLIIPTDSSKIPEALRRFSDADAQRWQDFARLIEKIGHFFRSLNDVRMPDGFDKEPVQISELLSIGWKFRRLGKKDMREFLRVLPMSIFDFLNEWFEAEPLKGALATRGIFGTCYGPRAQGTSLTFLHHQCGNSNSGFRTAGLVRGGMSRLGEALARSARNNGAEVRTDCEVTKIVTRQGRVNGVVVDRGDQVSADLVVSNADIKRTFLELVDPTYLDPEFLLKVKNIRTRGTLAKLNLALDGLPSFDTSGSEPLERLCGGIICIAPSLDYLERAADVAKYGRFSEEPFLEITIPSVADPTLAPSGKHVMSIWMQYAPYHLRDGNWAEERDALADTIINVIENYAYGFKRLILARQVLTPLDLEINFGLTEGHIYHAELALDQMFFMRPVPGWARYKTPINGLYLCGSGTHPGGGISGLPGYYAAKEILANEAGRG